MPIGITDIINLAGFVISLFNSPSPAPAQQCVEAPKVQAAVDQRVYVRDAPREDYCNDVSKEEWERVGQSMFDAFEGTRSKNDICKGLVSAQRYVKK